MISSLNFVQLFLHMHSILSSFCTKPKLQAKLQLLKFNSFDNRHQIHLNHQMHFFYSTLHLINKVQAQYFTFLIIVSTTDLSNWCLKNQFFNSKRKNLAWISQVYRAHGSKGHTGADRVTPSAYIDGMKPCSHPLFELLIVFPDEYFFYQPYEHIRCSAVIWSRIPNYKGDPNKRINEWVRLLEKLITQRLQIIIKSKGFRT